MTSKQLKKYWKKLKLEISAGTRTYEDALESYAYAYRKNSIMTDYQTKQLERFLLKLQSEVEAGTRTYEESRALYNRWTGYFAKHGASAKFNLYSEVGNYGI